MSTEAKNLEAICRAIDQHAANCGEPLVSILLSPFEYGRLGWEEIRGIAVGVDPKLGTGRFRLVCSGIHGDEEPTITEAVSTDRPLVTASSTGTSTIRKAAP